MNVFRRLFSRRPKPIHNQDQTERPIPASAGSAASSPGEDRPPLAEDLAELLAKPTLVPDPVFPKEGYLEAFGGAAFRQLLVQFDNPKLVEHIQLMNTNQQIAMFSADGFGFWAIDLDAHSERGVSGRDEFIARVKVPIRRPPPSMAAFAVEQHILARGVAKIQIEDEPPVPGLYQICRVKVVGWYLAALVSPANPENPTAGS